MTRKIRLFVPLFVVIAMLSVFGFVSCGKRECTVSFDSNGGSEVASIVVSYGEKIPQPYSIFDGEYTFDGWYRGNSKWNFSRSKVTSDMTLTARWTQGYTDGLKYALNEDGSYCVTSFGEAKSNYITVPSIYRGSPVTSIGDNAFFGHNKIGAVWMPDSVLSIGSYAFANCSSLEQIKISSSLNSIGEYAFINCVSLSDITIPQGVSEIPSYCFRNCKSLRFPSMGDIVSFCPHCFSGCESFTEIEIPESTEFIGTGAFEGCLKIESAYIPERTADLYDGVFMGCTSLKIVVIQSPISHLEKNFFAGCVSLESVQLPSTVASIGYKAFYRCSSLTKISFPASLAYVEEYAFSHSAISEVTFGGSASKWKGVTIKNHNEALQSAKVICQNAS